MLNLRLTTLKPPFFTTTQQLPFFIGLTLSEPFLISDRTPDLKIRLNFPGIGFGCLKREQVELLLTPLPSNITICTKPFFTVLRVCQR